MMTQIMNRLFNCSIASLLFNAVAVTSMKHHFRIRKANAIFGPLGEPFAFNKNGNYNMDLKDFKMYRKVGANSSAVIKNLDDYVGGFYLQKFDNEAEFYRYMETLKSDDNNDSSNNNGTRIQCSYQYFLDKDDPFDTINDDFDGSTIPQSSAKHGVLLKAYSSKNTINRVNYTFKDDEAVLYFLIYQVCPYNPNILSSFHIDFHFSNIDLIRNKVSYLSAGEIPLPMMFFLFSISYLLCFIIWFLNIIEILRGRPAMIGTDDATQTKPIIYTIHYLMAILLILKFLSVFFESVRYHRIQRTGHAEVLSFLFYAFSVLKGMFLFTVILLIGSGWSFVKSSLNTKEKRVIMFVLFLQVINNVALAIVSQETIGETYYSKLVGLIHMVDIICCCAVIVPIFWQVNRLESMIGEGDDDVDTIRNDNGDGVLRPAIHRDDDEGRQEKEHILVKLRTFRTFYMLVFAYIYATRILIYLFVSTLTYKYLWVQHFIIELVTLTFYVIVGIMFRPKPEGSVYERVSTNQEQELETFTSSS